MDTASEWGEGHRRGDGHGNRKEPVGGGWRESVLKKITRISEMS